MFRRASDFMRQTKATEERVLVIEAWYKFETSLGEGNEDNIKDVAAKRPKKIKKRRIVTGEDGVVRAPSLLRARWHLLANACVPLCCVSTCVVVCLPSLPLAPRSPRTAGRSTLTTCSRMMSEAWAA